MTKILVIEDEGILRDEVIQWLMLENYEAFGAGDGLEGVREAFQHQPDLIICDITMPHLDGYGVLLELRTNPATATIPFIFVTARAAHEDIRKGMISGADDYITKPFTRLELLGAVRSQFAKKSAIEHKHADEVKLLRGVLAEEKEQRMLKARFVAMFSHDFRNPLSSILSSNSLLRNYADRMNSDQQETHFNRVEASVHQLIQMLDDMLVIAQMETGNLLFKPEQLNPDQLVQAVVEEFQVIYSETHSIVYDSHFNSDTSADPSLLRQIAVNLISNAVKYSPPESEIHVLLDRLDNCVALTVSDQGMGIPKIDQSRMFESFQRASNVGTIAGTGLGLAIVQQAADLHGGTVHLESQVGVGTSVMVKIPI